MRRINSIDLHEMERCWAIGEVKSQFFINNNPCVREETLSLLESDDLNKQKEGVEKYLQNSTKRKLIESFRSNAKWEWFSACLPVVKHEFSKLKVIKYPKWGEYSCGSYLLFDAANYLINNLGIDERICSIICGLPHKKIEMRGITLISQKNEGPYEIIEGNGRLVAVYYHCIFRGTKIFENDSLEVVLGISKMK